MRIPAVFLAGIAVLCSPLPSAQAATAKEPSAGEFESPGPSEGVAREDLGKKKRIAVLRFESTAKFGGGDVGEGLSAMLSNELSKSGRFIVLERAALVDILGEQELGAKGFATAQTAAKMGKLHGAQILVRGTVTDFEAQRGGRGAQISVGGGNLPLGGVLGGARTTAEVAIDLRLIDATTGEVIDTFGAKGQAKATSKHIGVQHTGTGVGFGTEDFNKTPLGQAALEAIQECVNGIIRKTDSIPWSGRVSEVTGDRIYVNAGADAGLVPGDVLEIYVIKKEITDPETGAILGIEEHRLGSLKIESVQPRYSVAERQEGPPPTAGDIVRARK